MGDLQRLFGAKASRPWTRPETYVGAMARKRRFRQRQATRPRTQPERPRLMLSTVPFLTLLAFLAVLAMGIMVLAFPGNQPPLREQPVAKAERGVAGRGWFQEAQKQFHR
jgi:hypothetical protein